MTTFQMSLLYFVYKQLKITVNAIFVWSSTNDNVQISLFNKNTGIYNWNLEIQMTNCLIRIQTS